MADMKVRFCVEGKSVCERDIPLDFRVIDRFQVGLKLFGEKIGVVDASRKTSALFSIDNETKESNPPTIKIVLSQKCLAELTLENNDSLKSSGKTSQDAHSDESLGESIGENRTDFIEELMRESDSDSSINKERLTARQRALKEGINQDLLSIPMSNDKQDKPLSEEQLFKKSEAIKRRRLLMEQKTELEKRSTIEKILYRGVKRSKRQPKSAHEKKLDPPNNGMIRWRSTASGNVLVMPPNYTFPHYSSI